MEIGAHDFHLGLLGPERLDWTAKLYSGCQADVVVTSVTSLFSWVCLSSGGLGFPNEETSVILDSCPGNTEGRF
jgi:hypothetical protein